jgi:hypothetical protein
LPVNIAWIRSTSGCCNRCRPGDRDELADSYGAAKADFGFEIGSRRDEFPRHNTNLRWSEGLTLAINAMSQMGQPEGMMKKAEHKALPSLEERMEELRQP